MECAVSFFFLKTFPWFNVELLYNFLDVKINVTKNQAIVQFIQTELILLIC